MKVLSLAAAQPPRASTQPAAGARCWALALGGLVGAVAPGLAPAQTPAVAVGELPATVITATRSDSRIDEQLAEVTVITRTQLDALGGRTLAEVLGRAAGVQFSANGGPGKQSGVYLRGLEARHVLLLVDGVRYGSATAGIPLWDNLPLEQIERIEIVRGPLSSLYGADAVGGVVQVFTRRGAGAPRAHAALAAGSQRTGQAALGLAGAVALAGGGAVDYALQAQALDTRSFSATNPRAPFGAHHPDDDGWRQRSVTASVGWRVVPGWSVRANLLDARGTTRFDDGVPATNPAVDTQARLQTTVGGVQLAGRLADGWTVRLAQSRSIDANDTTVAANAFALGEFRSTQDQTTLESSTGTPLGTALLAIDALRQTVAKSGPDYPVKRRTVEGVVLGLDGGVGAQRWQLSARHDRNSQFGTQDNGSAAYALALGAWRLGAAVGTSFTAPSFNQLYFPGFGNPLLQPEQGRHRELSVRWAHGPTELRVAAFDHRIRGFITAGPVPVNIPRSRADGWTASYARHGGGWQVAATLDLLDPRNEATGKLLPRRAQRSATLRFDRELGAFRLGAGALAAGPRYDDAANTLRLPGYAVLDLRADWRVAAAWSAQLALNNALDRRYETAYGFNQAPRTWLLTLRYAPR